MKKLLLPLICLLVAAGANAQVFNTGATLKKETFSIGVEPVFINNVDGFMLFAHAGYGLKQGITIGVSAGMLNGQYFGANVKWAMAKYISLTTGAHFWGDFGLDGMLNLTFPIKSDSRIFTGVDADINFPKSGVNVPIMIPVGVQIGLRKNMAFILEGEIGVTKTAYNMLGGGVVVYF